MSRPPRHVGFVLEWPDGEDEDFVFTVPLMAEPCLAMFEGDGLGLDDKLGWIVEHTDKGDILRARALDPDDPLDISTVERLFSHLASATTGRSYPATLRLTYIALNSWPVLDVFATERGLPELDTWTWSRLLNVTERLYLGTEDSADRMRKETELAKPLPGQSMEDAAEGTAFSAEAQYSLFKSAQK